MKNTTRIICLIMAMISLLSACSVAFAGGEYTVYTADGGRLNMRKSASTDATIILYIPHLTPVDDMSPYANPVSGWTYIGSWGYKYGETPGYNHYEYGWVMSRFLI